VRTLLLSSGAAALILLAGATAPAAAQGQAQTQVAGMPFLIHAQAGVTLPGPSGGLFGAGAGVGLPAVPGLAVFGEFGRLTNIMTGELQDIVDELAGVDESEDFDFEFDIALPTTYLFGGARYEVETNGPLGVFVEGGVGIGRVGMDVTLVVEGEDFSELFEDLLEEEGVAEPSTEPLFVVGGGVSWPMTPRLDVTGGLRINRVAAGDGITKTALYVGLFWRP
jgi:hypothetical protein